MNFKTASFFVCSLLLAPISANANILIPGGTELPVIPDSGSANAFAQTGLELLTGYAMQDTNDIMTVRGPMTASIACISFENTGAKTINAIRWGLSVADAFGTPLTTFYGDRSGSFTQGAIISGTSSKNWSGNKEAQKNCWKFYAPHGAQIRVRPVKVAYSDGTTWQYVDNTPQSAPLPTR